ncbi:hypothetical protein OERS_38640 [Oerskovia enterophila]|uniref:Secreted protein n=1 Tax=Oerskovia enterophila TaxID=43678 RepID=A0ABX2Y0Z0_9CELL|nr:hypothetical protein OERS_38640 [Oerskovia enterophila]
MGWTLRVAGSGVATASSCSCWVMYSCWSILSRTRLRRASELAGFVTGSYLVGAFVTPAMVAASTMPSSEACLPK